MSFIVVGGGPSGLAFCHYSDSPCVLYEAAASIGGCHAVDRSNDCLFAEHSPRVVFESYVCFIDLLEDMGYTMDDLYRSYDFSAQSSILPLIKQGNAKDALLISSLFTQSCLWPEAGKNRIVAEAIKHFSLPAKDIIRRICKLTDGADANRLTLHEFMYAVQMSFIYKGKQPRLPNDLGLFKIWQSFLTDKGHQIETNCGVKQLVAENDIIVRLVLNDDKEVETINANVILAIPPVSFYQLLKKSNLLDAYETNIEKWAAESQYDTYYSFCIHYKEIQNIPHVWGFPRGNFGVGFIDMNGTDFHDLRSVHVISCCVIFDNIQSIKTGKTLNEMLTQNSEKEIITECLRQINMGLRYPDYVTRPNQVNKAYVTTTLSKHGLPFQTKYKNLFTLGTHNEKHTIGITSMESAVQNALVLAKQFGHGQKFYLKKAYNLFEITQKIIFVLLFLVVVMRG